MKYAPNQLVILIITLSGICSNRSFAVQPSNLSIGNLMVTPILVAKETYDTNIFSQPRDETDSWITRISPALSLTTKGKNETFNLFLGHETGIYHSSHNDNYHDNRLISNFLWDFYHHNSLELNVRYIDSHDERGSEFSQGENANSISEPDTFKLTDAAAGYQLGTTNSTGRLNFELGNQKKKYTNHRQTTRFRDRSTQYYSAAFYYKIGAYTNLVSEIRIRDIDYANNQGENSDRSLDSVQTQYYIGFSWDVTEKTTGSFRAGSARKDFKDNEKVDFKGKSWEVSLDWSPKRYSVFSLESSQIPNETNGDGTFINERSTTASWKHEWSNRIYSKLLLSFENDLYEESASNREDTINRFASSIHHKTLRWLEFGIELSYLEKRSNIDEFEYQRGKFTFLLQGSL